MGGSGKYVDVEPKHFIRFCSEFLRQNLSEAWRIRIFNRGANHFCSWKPLFFPPNGRNQAVSGVPITKPCQQLLSTNKSVRGRAALKGKSARLCSQHLFRPTGEKTRKPHTRPTQIESNKPIPFHCADGSLFIISTAAAAPIIRDFGRVFEQEEDRTFLPRPPELLLQHGDNRIYE